MIDFIFYVRPQNRSGMPVVLLDVDSTPDFDSSINRIPDLIRDYLSGCNDVEVDFVLQTHRR